MQRGVAAASLSHADPVVQPLASHAGAIGTSSTSGGHALTHAAAVKWLTHHHDAYSITRDSTAGAS